MTPQHNTARRSDALAPPGSQSGCEGCCEEARKAFPKVTSRVSGGDCLSKILGFHVQNLLEFRQIRAGMFYRNLGDF